LYLVKSSKVPFQEGSERKHPDELAKSPQLDSQKLSQRQYWLEYTSVNVSALRDVVMTWDP
jgi:hypothetical protein